MTSIGSTGNSNLMIVLRLLDEAKRAEDRRNGKKVTEKTGLDYYNEDMALISGSAVAANKQNAAYTPPAENIDINLSDFKPATPDVKVNNPVSQSTVANEFVLEASQTVEIKLEMSYKENKPIDGLQVHDQNFAETDRYLFQFKDGTTFTILDKWANKSTTIWGDPHIDVSDVEGTNNGDFKDLTSSEDVTTFMLGDGSRVTFKAQDAGIIEQVDIFKGSQHVTGIGQASTAFSETNGLFNQQVFNDGASAASAAKLGDVVYAGGDGNDWFDASSKLVWGKTTGPVIIQRPSATLEFSYKQTVTQSISIQSITTRNA